MDGVLWESSKIHEKAYLESFKNIGIDLKQNFYNNIGGMKTENAVQLLINENKINIDKDILLNIVKMKKQIAQILLNDTEIINKIVDFEMVELIEMLKKKYFFKIALATSASRQTMNNYTEFVAKRIKFDTALCGEDVLNGKPDPEIYFKTVNKSNENIHESIVIEDSVKGVLAALNAGLRVIPYKIQIKMENSLLLRKADKPNDVLIAINNMLVDL
jgi:beta-phosphoglucomutase